MGIKIFIKFNKIKVLLTIYFVMHNSYFIRFPTWFRFFSRYEITTDDPVMWPNAMSNIGQNTEIIYYMIQPIDWHDRVII